MSDPRLGRPWWSRREILKGGAAVIAGAYGLLPRFGLAAEIPDKFDGTTFKLKAPEPNPKSGGVLRMGLTNRPPHFDVHQSGTFNNLGAQGCMFDNLIRRDPRDSGKTIIPDLAHSWEIAEDGKIYTFILRKVVTYPGTGPFRSVRRVENEVWVMEKNPNYWNKGMPYLDGVEFYHTLPFSPEMGSAILSGRVDYVRVTDPVTARKAKATPGMKATDYYQSVIQATWVNNKKKPLDDPRVRRAMHLAFDKPVLVDVVKDVAPMMVGGFIYPFSEFATPKEELVKRIGYQDDPTAALKEAQALLAAAGHKDGIKGLDFLVRDVATFKLWAQAIQAMLQQINIQCNLRTVVESVWFDDTKSGNFDLAVGAIVSTLLDPSDYFNAWYGKNGPQNYSFWDNTEFQALSAQIDREIDAEKRQDLIRQAEAIMEQDPPLLPISWEKINDVWYNYVKGHNPYEYFGLYDVVRLDTVWLDKT